MTNEQIKAAKEAVNEYFEYQKISSKINDLIADRFMFKLLSSGIDPKEAQEIYLETVVHHAAKNIDSRSYDFIKPFIKKEGNQ